MSYGFIPGVSRWSPFHGSAFAVVESMSKLLAIGANPLKSRLTFQEYFERLHEKPERWGKPAAALLGAMTAQINMGIPSIGGKDSMSGLFGYTKGAVIKNCNVTGEINGYNQTGGIVGYANNNTHILN